MAWMVSAKHPLRGLCGGDDASPYTNHFNVGTDDEYRIDLAVSAQLTPGAVIAYQHGGGAGFGPALSRDPEAVLNDVLDELISIDRARERYGVIFSGSLTEWTLEIDTEGTAALRAQMIGDAA